MDRSTIFIGGAVLGIILGILRGRARNESATPAVPAVTGLGYDQHNAGYTVASSRYPVGAGLGYFGTYPSGA